MALKRESALQRIQVGVIGLVVVLLFVSLANMLMDSAIIGDVNSDRGITEALFEEKAPDEPLAELGVAPVVESDESVKSKQQANQVKPKPQVQPNAQVSPNLQPTPDAQAPASTVPVVR
jgi:hypothetical protein